MRKFIASLLLLAFLLPNPALAAKVRKNDSGNKSINRVSTKEVKSDKVVSKTAEVALNTASTNTTGAPPDTSSYYNYKFDKLKNLDSFKGNFQTSLATGAATYAYPLTLPSGLNNLAPSLSLSYSSQNSKSGSLVGYGWNLPLAEIKRINTHGSEQIYNRTDFSLELFGAGGTLIPLNVPADSQFGDYGLQMENDFLKITLQNDKSWVARSKNGLIYTFGKTADTRLAYGENYVTDIFAWKLDEIRDMNDNFIKFTYQRFNYPDAGGQLYPASIIYTGHGNTNGPIRVDFILADRIDPVTDFGPVQFHFDVRKIVSRIDVKINDILRRQYVFDYSSEANRKRSLLKSIKEKGYGLDGTTLELPPTTFDYTPLKAEAFSQYSGSGLPADMYFVESNMPGYEIPIDNGVRVVDVNGDGLTDIVQGFIDYFNGGDPGEKQKFNTYINKSYVAADGTSVIQFVKDTVNYQLDGPLVGYDYQNQWNKVWEAGLTDLNGDYLSDLYEIRTNVNDLVESVDFFNNGLNGWYGQTTYKINLLGGPGERDLNGDGLVDSVQAYYTKSSGANPPQLNGQFLFNRGKETAKDASWTLPPLPFTDEYGNNYGTQLIDVNADGLPDLAEGRFYKKSDEMNCHWLNRVYLNTGKGWQTEPSSWKFPVPTVYSYPDIPLAYQDLGVRVFDYNGDGLMDVIAGDSMDSESYCATLPKVKQGIYINDGLAGWQYVGSSPVAFVGEEKKHTDNGVRIIDINGDGLDDLVMAIKNHYDGSTSQRILLNQNKRPDLLKKVTNPYGGSVEISYKPSTMDREGNDMTTKIPFVIQTVAEVKQIDGQGNTATMNYVYKNGHFNYYDFHEKDFGGFAEVIETNREKITHYYFYNGNNNGVSSYSDGQVLQKTGSDGGRQGFYVIDNGKKRSIQMWNPNESQPVFTDYYIRSCMPFYSSYYAQAISNSGNTGSYYRVIIHPNIAEIEAIPDGPNVSYGYTVIEGPATALNCGSVIENNPSRKIIPPEAGLSGKLYKTVVTDLNGKIFAVNFNKWEVKDLNSGAAPGLERYFPVVTRSVDFTYDGQTTHRDKASEFEYDASSGNLLKEHRLGEVTANPDNGDIKQDMNPSDNLNFEYQYAAGGNYLKSFPSQVILRDSTNKVIKWEMYYYDNQTFGQILRGNQTKVARWYMTEQGQDAWLFSQSVYDFDVYPNQPDKNFGLLKKMIDPNGNITTYFYEFENVTLPSDYPTTVQGNIYPISVIYPKTSLQIWQHYDLMPGEVDWLRDLNGQTVQRTFDPIGRLISIKVPNPLNNNLPTTMTQLTYNDLNKPWSVTSQINGGSGDPTVTSWKYFDGFGRLIQTKSQAEDNRYYVTSLAYDNQGNLRYETFQSKTGQSPFEKVDFTKIPKKTYSYDGLGRLIKTNINPLFGYFETTYNLWTVTETLWGDIDNDPEDRNFIKNKKKLDYDGFGRLMTVTEYYNSNPEVSHPMSDSQFELFKTNYNYDSNGNLTKITDALGNIRNFTYDAASRLLSMDMIHRPMETGYGAWQYSYDADSNLITTLDPNGNTVIYTYDAMNRPLTEQTAGKIMIQYSYDGDEDGSQLLPALQVKGKVSKVVRQDNSPYVISQFDYDSLGKVSKERTSIDNVVYETKYGTDLAGRQKYLIYPNQMQATYGYDDSGALNSVQIKEPGLDERPLIVGMNYNDQGQLQKVNYASGLSRDYVYADDSNLYRLAGLKTSKPNGDNLQVIGYNTDTAGNVTGLDESAPLATNRYVDYGYDSLNRLVYDRFYRPDNIGRRDYSYNAIGNITYKTGIGYYNYDHLNTNTTNNPQAVNGITPNGDPNNITRQIFYDKNGNLVKDGTSIFIYNYRNELTATGLEKYVYDYSGRRVKKIVDGQVTTYLNDFFDKDQHTENYNFYAGSHLIASWESVYNQIPIAKAGADKNGTLKTTVTIDGSLSSDPDKDSLIYRWQLTQKPTGSTAQLINADKAKASFVPDVFGQYRATLIVNDGYEDSLGDEMIVTVTDKKPVANAGPDQTAFLNGTVQLDGSRSSDPEKATLTYNWSLITKPIGSMAVLSSQTIAKPTFKADVLGTYTAQLIVSDGTNQSTPDTVNISVVINQPPVANAGPDQSVTVKTKAQLNGNQSSDPEKKPLKYTWRIITKPTNSVAKLSSTTIVNPTVTPDLVGSYTIGLKVSDGQMSSTEDTMLITATAVSAGLPHLDKLIAALFNFKIDGVEAKAGPVLIAAVTTTTTTGPRLIAKNWYYHFTDHLGSSSLVTKEDGTIVLASDYYPYGEKRTYQSYDNTFSTRKQFTGKEQDATKLYYFGARYYEPGLGRFMSMDPLTINDFNKAIKMGELNAYRYTMNNPLKYVDPTGRLTVNVWHGEGGSNGAWGHVSVRLENGTYISWWPQKEGREGPLTEVGVPVYTVPAIEKQTYDKDKEYEGGANGPKDPDVQIKITNLDEKKIEEWWNKFKDNKDNKWSTLDQNCSTTAADALKAGGGKKGLWWWQYTEIIWEPEDVEKFANAIVENYKKQQEKEQKQKEKQKNNKNSSKKG